MICVLSRVRPLGQTLQFAFSMTLLGCLIAPPCARSQNAPPAQPATGQTAQPAAPATLPPAAPQRVRPIDAAAPLPDRAAMLRGAYGPFRANNDLLYYHLTVRVDPDDKSLKGKNTIRFRMLKDGTRIQIDLQEPLDIDKIVYGSTELKYQRDTGGAVFIDFPQTLHAGQIYSIDFYYSGHPRTTGRFGGITFKTDPAGHTWINTACEGIGASIWWPNKDQWRDEVENMDISVEIPNNLVDVSNGKFVGKTNLGDGYTRWDWHVSYPINNYDVSLNIGDYVHFATSSATCRSISTSCPPTSQSQNPVRPGQRHARGLPALLRRIPLRQGWLQTRRSSLLRHGTPERRHLRQHI